MTDSFKEFSVKERWKGRRTFKFKQSFTIRDGFNFYRATRPKESKFVLTEQQFSKIISSVNLGIGDKIMEGFVVRLPSYMGEIFIQKRKVEPYLDSNGKLVFNSPVNWNETLKLWHSSQEAKEEKIVVKMEARVSYSIKYSKKKAHYLNQNYVGFRPQRSFKQRLSILANQGKIEGYLKKVN